MTTSSDYFIIGIVGVGNVVLLCSMILYRLYRFLARSPTEDFNTRSFNRKLTFYFLLLLSVVCETPMYVGFILIRDYAVVPYSFHRFQSMFLFNALSLMVRDWARVLYDIREYDLYPFWFRKATLLSLNVVYVAISLVNFVYCYFVQDIDEYTASPLYLLSFFLQICVSLCLVVFMLHAGWKLGSRIQGAAGGEQQQVQSRPQSRTQAVVDVQQRHSGSSEPFTDSQQQQSNSAYEGSSHYESGREQLLRPKSFLGGVEFRGALYNLNLVLATCTICILMQVVVLLLNFAFGEQGNPSTSVGPTFLAWLLYNWLPLWGPVCALLYLFRTHGKQVSPQSGGHHPPQDSDHSDTIDHYYPDRDPSATADKVSARNRLNFLRRGGKEVNPLRRTSEPGHSSGSSSSYVCSGNATIGVDSLHSVHSGSLNKSTTGSGSQHQSRSDLGQEGSDINAINQAIIRSVSNEAEPHPHPRDPRQQGIPGKGHPFFSLPHMGPAAFERFNSANLGMDTRDSSFSEEDEGVYSPDSSSLHLFSSFYYPNPTHHTHDASALNGSQSTGMSQSQSLSINPHSQSAFDFSQQQLVSGNTSLSQPTPGDQFYRDIWSAHQQLPPGYAFGPYSTPNAAGASDLSFSFSSHVSSGNANPAHSLQHKGIQQNPLDYSEPGSRNQSIDKC